MTLVVDVATDGVRVPLARTRVAELARRVLRAERAQHALLSIAFLPARAMATLNERHLGRRGPTDVIAFGFAPAGASGPIVGDIYIAPEVARANARRLGIGSREEVARLVVHGTLHVLGYAHPERTGRETSPMWRRQERLLRRLTRAHA
jgi:probable rRNA maturation factor